MFDVCIILISLYFVCNYAAGDDSLQEQPGSLHLQLIPPVQ